MPALFEGGTALSQLRVFIVFPLVGGVLAALVLPLVLGEAGAIAPRSTAPRRAVSSAGDGQDSSRRTNQRGAWSVTDAVLTTRSNPASSKMPIMPTYAAAWWMRRPSGSTG